MLAYGCLESQTQTNDRSIVDIFFSFRESWLKLITEEPPVLTCTLHTRLETVDFPPRHMLLSYKSVFLNLPLRSPARYYSFFTNLLCTQFLFHIQSHCWLNSITGKGHKSDFIARRQSRVDEKFLPTTLSKTFGALWATTNGWLAWLVGKIFTCSCVLNFSSFNDDNLWYRAIRYDFLTFHSLSPPLSSR